MRHAVTGFGENVLVEARVGGAGAAASCLKILQDAGGCQADHESDETRDADWAAACRPGLKGSIRRMAESSARRVNTMTVENIFLH